MTRTLKRLLVVERKQKKMDRRIQETRNGLRVKYNQGTNLLEASLLLNSIASKERIREP